MRLRVDPIKCVGHGLCAELLPELIGLDPWGYPLLADAEVPRDLAAHARRAVAGCPTLALLASSSTGGGSLVTGFAGVRHGGRNPG